MPKTGCFKAKICYKMVSLMDDLEAPPIFRKPSYLYFLMFDLVWLRSIILSHTKSGFISRFGSWLWHLTGCHVHLGNEFETSPLVKRPSGPSGQTWNLDESGILVAKDGGRWTSLGALSLTRLTDWLDQNFIQLGASGSHWFEKFSLACQRP